jgi:drug/metabolite transporter (DMT)-like permease
MRVAALLLAVAAATAWGFGGILLKRGVTVVSPTTILVFQYVLGVVVLGGWVLTTGGASGGIDSVRDRWPALAVISVLQITGYVCFTLAVRHAGAGSIPTATAVAIAASYPALVAVLSGPLLDESLGWHQVVGVALVIGGVIVSQL